MNVRLAHREADGGSLTDCKGLKSVLHLPRHAWLVRQVGGSQSYCTMSSEQQRRQDRLRAAPP